MKKKKSNKLDIGTTFQFKVDGTNQGLRRYMLISDCDHLSVLALSKTEKGQIKFHYVLRDGVEITKNQLKKWFVDHYDKINNDPDIRRHIVMKGNIRFNKKSFKILS